VAAADPPTPYVLGHSSRELERLTAQARLIEPFTRRFFLAAGIRSGMRVLDVGSGAGDVAFLAAELVGDTGKVVGVDLSGAALEVARTRAADLSLQNVSFVDGDPARLSFDRPFDAAVGRYVLQFQSDPVSMLRGIVAHVGAGGIVAFQELDWEGVKSIPPVPTFDRACTLSREVISSSAEIHMGRKLFSTFVEAGLTAPTLLLEAPVGVEEPMRLKAELAGSLAAKIEERGLASAAELDPDKLFEQMLVEARATKSFAIGNQQFAAWTRVEMPGS
jgi:SAM-dependent methyltransferase